MSTLIQDLRQAARSMLKSPALTAAAVLSLALGIGANTVIFTWVQAVLLRPIPGAASPGDLYVAAMSNRDGQPRSWSYPNYRDVRGRATLVDFVALDDIVMSFALDGSADRALGGLVSGNFFQVMGVGAAAGRLLTPDDDRTPGGHPVVVLSHAYWQRRFAGDPAIVGRQVTLNNQPFTVIGVAQQGFIGGSLGLSTAAWVSMAMQAQMTGASRLEARGNGWFETFARLRPGASRESAGAELDAIMRQLEQEYPDPNSGRRVRLVHTWAASFGAPSVLAPVLGVLSVVVVLVLVIACANVANLLLARAVGRRREIAIRLSLGASRAHLLRQLLTESLVLALVAGAAGMVLVYWTSGLLMAFIPPVDIPIDLGLRVDPSAFAFALAASAVTGMLFGLAPAWQASTPDTVEALKEEAGRGSGGRRGHRLRSALVVAQVAVCFVLLVGAGLFTRSLAAAQRLDPGFDHERQATASMDLFSSGYTPETGRQFHRRGLERVAALPGVQSVAFARQLPLGFSGRSSGRVDIDGYTPRPDEEVTIGYNQVSTRYFETMGIPIIAGREFTGADAAEGRRAVVVNETMAKRYWGERDPVGLRIRNGGGPAIVVGVARDIKYYALNETPQPHMYLNLATDYVSGVVLQARVSGDPAAFAASLRGALHGLDASLPLWDVRPLSDHMEQAFFAQRIGANLLGVMGTLALLLAAVGLYGVVAYATSQRTHEMGIRLALGAAPGDLRRMVIVQGARLTGAGLAIGLAAALGATPLVRSLLPGITPTDPITFALVPVALLLIALVAAWIPARRASGVDPIVALRHD
ncbi:MAG: hypothetical protein A3H97_17880 [Acidobacteria bacterium RIFCSPLOWO2_02_FULL_65_29]|nr:MAG: hypothetical protein A3H97_17880 [Acidobacteria bacterium RIFCSPLOWO2_02_FULL_65_29]